MTDAPLGAQAAISCNVGIAVETTSGVAATAPTDYIVMGGDIQPITKKPMNTKDIAGSMFPSLGTRGTETFEMPFPMLPVIEDTTSPVRRNGLGTMLLCLFGANDATALVADYAYEHTFTWETLIKTFTTWVHYGTNQNDKIRMCAMDNLAIRIKTDGTLTLDFKGMGADKSFVLDTDYGTAAYCSMATAKQISGLKTRLEFGQPGAAVRSVWEEISIDLKRNLSQGGMDSAGQHPASSGSPQTVTSAKSNVEVGINLRDLDLEEIKRGYAGGNIAPTATRMSDLYDLVKCRISIYGPTLYAGINGEADYLNAGTTTGTFAGSYSGGTTVEVGEIEMSNSDVYETALGTNKDLSFRLLDAAATYEVETGSGVLACNVAGKDIMVTLASGGSTAAAVLAKILATPAAVALITPTLAVGSTGAGTISDAQAKVTSSSFKDGFRYRYNTGTGWSAWTNWIKVTEAAQTLHAGITCDFSQDDTAATGDRLYYCSHYRFMLRFTLPDMNYSDAPNANFSGGIRKADIKLYHPNTGTDPSCDLWDSKTTAYS